MTQIVRTAPPCSQYCRAYQLTLREFERLGGKRWEQSFRVRLGVRANKLYLETYGETANKVRPSAKSGWGNKVGKYPCGILEQAYREVTRGRQPPSRGSLVTPRMSGRGRGVTGLRFQQSSCTFK